MRAVFFDLDETLLDDSTSYEQSITRTCSELAACFSGLEAGPLGEAYRLVSNAYWSEVAEGVISGALDGQTVRLEGWRRTLLACGCELAEAAEAALAAYSRYRRESYSLFADALPLLDALKRRLPMVLITNGSSEPQWDKVRTLGLEPYFDAVLVSGEVGYGKPKREIFQLALDKLRLQPESAVHVGDSLAADVAGALGAGLTAVWLNRRSLQRPRGQPQPHHEIASLADLTSRLSL